MATGFTGTVSLSISDTAASFTGGKIYTFTSGTGEDDGVHTFTAALKTVAASPNTQSITAVSGGVTGTESGITVAAAALAQAWR